MKKFFSEFKKFITRGNVIDMAVGVTVGSAFTAIVNGMTNYILKPIINWFLALLLGANSLSEMFTFLKKVTKDVVDEAGNVTGTEIDLANSIYIDWGSFINSVLNFLIIAFVLFSIVKVINNLKDGSAKIKAGKISKEDKKELKARGIKLSDKDAVKAYFDEKEAKAKAEAEAAAAAQAEADKIAKENSTEYLLREIRDLLANKQ